MNSLIPTSFKEAEEYARLISQSGFCPKEYKGKPADILLCIQFGIELGLKPLQALQNIAVIQGKPCLYGDALLAIVQQSPNFENIHEKVENGVAICKVKRKNIDEIVRTFSIEDATKAGLLNRPVWKQYQNRMLQMRARAFALRDAFASELKGFSVREEVEDYVQPSTTTKTQENYSPKTLSALIENQSSREDLNDALSAFKKHAFEIGISNKQEYMDMVDYNNIDESSPKSLRNALDDRVVEKYKSFCNTLGEAQYINGTTKS